MAKKKTKQTKVTKKVTKEVPVEAPKKKKKKHTGLKVFAILMTIFVVFPIAFVFIAFFDTSTKKVSNKEIHYENLVAETFYNSVGNLVDTGSLGFTINEEMIDGIMTSACDKINQKQFIPKMYCTIRGNHYTFFVDLQASFFKTRVQLQTTLKDDEENVLIFKINQLVIGRLPIPVNWATAIAGNFIKDDMLNNAFEQAGFRIKCHLAKAQLTYSREDFREDVAKYVEKLASNNEYLKLVFDVLGTCTGDDDLIKAEYNDGVTAAIDLYRLKIPDISSKLPLQFTQLDEHKTKITEWLNAGILDPKDPNKVADVFSYLVRGYNLSKDEIKTYVTSVAPLGEAIEEYTKAKPELYKGSYVNKDNQRFETYCGDKKINLGFTYEIPSAEAISLNVSLQENDLNEYLAATMWDAIGKTIPIVYQDSDSTWRFEYIVVDNFFIDLVEGKTSNNPQMNMYLSLNISGFQICLEVINNNIRIEGAISSGEAETSSFGKIAFDLKDINFGTIPVKDATILETVLNMIPASETFTFVKDGENGYFTIDLDTLITDEETKSKKSIIAALITENKFTKKVEYSEEDKSDILKLNYTKST